MTRERDATTAKSICSNIEKFRKKIAPERGGQKKVAEQYGVDSNKWSRWERGTATPTDLEQRKLADFFGISLAELRGEKIPPAPGSISSSVFKELEAMKAVLLEQVERIDRLLDERPLP